MTRAIRERPGVGTFKYKAFMALDASGAFDRVLHSRLIAILASHNVPSYVISFVQRWLTGRHVEETPIWRGIPQGSPLSLFLYCLYAVREVFIAATEVFLVLSHYVDDDGALLMSNNRKLLMDTLLKVLALVAISSVLLGLSLNQKKTQITLGRHY